MEEEHCEYTDFPDVEVETVVGDDSCDHIFKFVSSGFRNTETYECVKCKKLKYHKYYD